MDNLFDEHGEIDNFDALWDKFVKQGYLDGEDASLYLAQAFANETHGNYSTETLFERASIHTSLNIRIERK